MAARGLSPSRGARVFPWRRRRTELRGTGGVEQRVPGSECDSGVSTGPIPRQRSPCGGGLDRGSRRTQMGFGGLADLVIVYRRGMVGLTTPA